VQKHQASIRLRTSIAGTRHGTCIAVFIPDDREGGGLKEREVTADTASGTSARSSAAASGSDLSAA
jgi:hypothetical protein